MKNKVDTDKSDALETSRNQAAVKKITWIGLIINIGLTSFKFVVGLIGNSQAVVADAFHSFSDMATDIVVLAGVRFWDAPPDETHPYGHRRIQTLSTFFIGFALLAVGLAIGYKAMVTLREIHRTPPGWIALTGPFLSIILKEWLYRRTVHIGTRAKSPAVIANAWHHRSDALSSIPAFISVLASTVNPEWTYFDHIGAVIVALFIIKVSWDILKPVLTELTEHAASENDRRIIVAIAQSVAGVHSIHNIRTRKMGSGILLDLHIEVDPESTVRDGHRISMQVKTELIRRGPEIIDVVVHLEPYETQHS